LFITQPWSLFFIILSVFSLLFTLYQRDRGAKAWTLYYTPALLLALPVPLIMMGGFVRPALSVVLIGLGLAGLYQARKSRAAMKAEIIDS
jgi:putative tricarboxylic transport membrane protein